MTLKNLQNTSKFSEVVRITFFSVQQIVRTDRVSIVIELSKQFWNTPPLANTPTKQPTYHAQPSFYLYFTYQVRLFENRFVMPNALL